MTHRERIFTLGAALTSAMLGASLLVGSPGAPQVSVEAVNPGTSVERGLCLSVSLAPGAASECGDLRLAHALPAVRTLGQARAPVLLYNSQHASPRPIVAANVVLPNGSSGLSRVVATLKVNGTPRGQGVWKGSAWPGSGPVRIAVSYDAARDSTGPYRYTLEVNAVYGSTVLSDTARGQLVVVNRRQSAFGAGWWLAGLERLVLDPFGKPLLWVGGDGSTRRYTAARGDSVWGAESLDRPDTLKRSGHGWVRLLPGGVRVEFDAGGRHVATVNRLAHRTEFVYDSVGRVRAVTIPEPPGEIVPIYPAFLRAFTFAYGADGRVERAESPGIAGTRVTWIQRTGLRVDSIRDPDGTQVRFGYAGTALVPASRSNRLGVATQFRLDAAGRVIASRLDFASPNGLDPNRMDSIVLRLRPVQSLGLARADGTGAADTSQAYALIDGPRTDVGDSTRLWLDRWGAPRRIRDGLDHETRLTRGDARFPILVTRAEYANGRTVGAEYDARGNLSAQTDSSLRDTRGGYATTRYLYDARWDAVTRVTLPEGEVTHSEYDGEGNLRWTQPGQDSARRTRFEYYPRNEGGLPRSVKAPLMTAQRFMYDARGNLRETRVTDGGVDVVTQHELDALGRDTLVRSPDGAYSITRYDAAGRVWETMAWGPSKPYINANSQTRETPEQRLWVRSYFNAEGQTDSIARWQAPDTTHIGRLVTRWRYDEAGRRVQEIAPDSTPNDLADNPRDTTVYDLAGNATSVRSRRGLWTYLSYDVLNRLESRRTDPVEYPNQTRYAGDGTGQRPLFFPLYSQDAEGNFTVPNSVGQAEHGVRIAGDTATFAYDVAGNLVAAINRDAIVRREYNVSGTLHRETQRILTYAGRDTLGHVYQLEYEYDGNGRRTKLYHPDIFFSVRPTQYRYDTISGGLASVTDHKWHGYLYTYDEAGRVQERQRGSVRETFAYDSLGRLATREERVGTEVFHNDQLTYDRNTGKVVAVAGRNLTAKLVYNGMGALAYSDEERTSGNGGRKTEEYETDAMGNQLHSVLWGGSLETVDPNGHELTEHRYQAGTGRLVQSKSEDLTWEASYGVFDAGGNRVFYRSDQSSKTAYRLRANGLTYTSVVAKVHDLSVSYYGADERLRVVDRRGCLTFEPQFSVPDCDLTREPSYDKKSAFEEYRYDALGRRVLVRTRQEFACTSFCHHQLRRAIWDGDQLLYEIAAPGSQTTPAAEMERDTGLATPLKSGKGVAAFFPTGRVEYVHGAELDAPLALYREEYSDSVPPAYHVPMSNWRGTYDGGDPAPNCYLYHWTRAATEPSDSTIDEDGGNGFSGTTPYCADVAWPAKDQWTAFQYRPGYTGPAGWMGSLIDGQRDFSGLYYRRNRFYDPEQGRFTQEDPIGLAGGINLYGFANGDPVSYSDPYGLCKRDKDGNEDPECRSVITLLQVTAQAAEMSDEARIELRFAANAYELYEGDVELVFSPQAKQWGGATNIGLQRVQLNSSYNNIDLAMAAYHESQHMPTGRGLKHVKPGVGGGSGDQIDMMQARVFNGLPQWMKDQATQTQYYLRFTGQIP